jgi:hypothetical protein
LIFNSISDIANRLSVPNLPKTGEIDDDSLFSLLRVIPQKLPSYLSTNENVSDEVAHEAPRDSQRPISISLVRNAKRWPIAATRHSHAGQMAKQATVPIKKAMMPPSPASSRLRRWNN